MTLLEAVNRIVDGLCGRYPSLTPLEVYEADANDVFDLFGHIGRRPAAAGVPAAQGPHRVRVTAKTATGGWY